MEIFATPRSPCADVFCAIPTRWNDDNEMTSNVFVPNPPVLAYYSDMIFDRVDSDSPVARDSILVDVAMITFNIMAVVTFLSTTRDEEHLDCHAQERRTGCGILFRLPKACLSILDAVGGFHVVCASSFHASRSYRVYHLSSSIDWSKIY